MKNFLGFLKPYIKETAAAPLFKMTEALFELFVPVVIARIIDTGIANGDRDYILGQCGILALLAVAGLLFSVTAQFFAAKAAVGFGADIREKLSQKILSFSGAQYDRGGISRYITAMTSDVNAMQNGVNLGLRLLLRSPFVVFGAAIMAFTVDAKSALTFVFTIPLLAAAVFGIMLSTMPLYRVSREKLDAVTLAVRRNLGGVRVIRAFCKEEEFDRDFRKRTDELYKTSLKAESISSALAPVTYVIVNLATVVLIYCGALRVNSGVLTKGSVVALYNYMGQILVELVKLANLIITLTKAAASGKRVAAVLGEEPSMTYPWESAEPACDAPAVEMKNVSFTYEGAGDETLTDISLTIDRGKSLGIIGATGSGKSTLLSLIYRYYDATSGEIKLFGNDIKAYDKSRLTSMTGVVPQKAVLFSGTIKDNILFGCEDADADAFTEAVTVSQSSDIIEKKKNGADEMLEEAGAGLSGGQRQRLTVARALVKRPPLIILDDSSSALDVTTDRLMRSALKKLPYNPTVILSAQRISAVKDCDLIAVLDDGRLAGLGTHENLLENCDVYREIYDSQKGGAGNDC